ncbi:MAG: hypothetical protein SGPRY_013622 [Prymnesium sp.]
MAWGGLLLSPAADPSARRRARPSCGIKFIFPSAPRRTIHWPADGVCACYVYFTSRANTMFQDEIDLAHLASVTEQSAP